MRKGDDCEKDLKTRFVLTMTLSLCSAAFAAEVRYDDAVDEVTTVEDIEFAKDVYEALPPKAKAMFEAALAGDMELLQFHKTYADPSSKTAFTPQRRAHRARTMAAAAAAASAVVVIAANWDAVHPKFGPIARAFQKAFSTTANHISSASAQIKSDAKVGGNDLEISYYAIFDYKDYDKNEKKYGISITFPDVPEANSCARNEKEAVDMALEVLQLSLIGDDGHWPARTAFPPRTPMEKIRSHPCEKALLIKFDTDEVDLSKFKFFDRRQK